MRGLFLSAALIAATASAAPGSIINGRSLWKPKPVNGAWEPSGWANRPHWPVWPSPSATSSSTAGPTQTALPAVDSEGLQALISAKNLLAKAQDLEDIAYATPGRNRVMGSPGHNNTVAYLVESLEAFGDYYNVGVQPFIGLYAEGESTLTVDGESQGGDYFTYSPGGNVTAPIIAVLNLGCNASDYPAELDGNIALISRGTCEFGLKSALAGAAGATAAVIYNNEPGLIGGGTLGPPPRPEGDYIITVGIAQENGTAILASLDAGTEVTGVIVSEADLYNVTTYVGHDGLLEWCANIGQLQRHCSDNRRQSEQHPCARCALGFSLRRPRYVF